MRSWIIDGRKSWSWNLSIGSRANLFHLSFSRYMFTTMLEIHLLGKRVIWARIRLNSVFYLTHGFMGKSRADKVKTTKVILYEFFVPKILRYDEGPWFEWLLFSFTGFIRKEDL